MKSCFLLIALLLISACSQVQFKLTSASNAVPPGHLRVVISTIDHPSFDPIDTVIAFDALEKGVRYAKGEQLCYSHEIGVIERSGTTVRSMCAKNSDVTNQSYEIVIQLLPPNIDGSRSLNVDFGSTRVDGWKQHPGHYSCVTPQGLMETEFTAVPRIVSNDFATQIMLLPGKGQKLSTTQGVQMWFKFVPVVSPTVAAAG